MKNVTPLLKAVIILAASVFCLLYYLGVLTQRKTLPDCSKDFVGTAFPAQVIACPSLA